MAVYAVIRLRGSRSIASEIQQTLEMLRLRRVNTCVLIPDTPQYKGMLLKAKDYVTWGEPTKETVEKLVQKRGKTIGNKNIDSTKVKEITEKIFSGNFDLTKEGIKPLFRLSPPRKGLKTIKKHFPKGDLGNRGKEINQLIERMI